MSDNNNQKPKVCIVCGMPLKDKNDYPGGDTSLDYCKYCGTKDGIHSYKKLVEGMAKFLMRTQGMGEEEAKKAAKQMVDNSPAVKMGKVKVEN
ncbi:MAG: zinc ribbon domain-containing protein [Candidatus Dojkabacteria bacterium]|nr:zinc ribbon domain-containing protein [Candidatus Dojkabacteria bacterium]